MRRQKTNKLLNTGLHSTSTKTTPICKLTDTPVRKPHHWQVQLRVRKVKMSIGRLHTSTCTVGAQDIYKDEAYQSPHCVPTERLRAPQRGGSEYSSFFEEYTPAPRVSLSFLAFRRSASSFCRSRSSAYCRSQGHHTTTRVSLNGFNKHRLPREGRKGVSTYAYVTSSRAPDQRCTYNNSLVPMTCPAGE